MINQDLRHRVREQSIQNTCLSHRNFLISELRVFSHLDIYVNELFQQQLWKFVYYELFYVLFGLHICARSPTVFQGFSPIQKKFLRWSVMTDLIFLRSILLSDSRAAVITETKFRYKWSGNEFPLWVCLIFHFVKKYILLFLNIIWILGHVVSTIKFDPNLHLWLIRPYLLPFSS